MSDPKIHKFINQGVIFCEWCGAKPEEQKSGCRLPDVAAPSDVAAFGSFDPNWPRYVFTDSHMEALFKDVQKAPRWALIQELSRPVY